MERNILLPRELRSHDTGTAVTAFMVCDPSRAHKPASRDRIVHHRSRRPGPLFDRPSSPTRLVPTREGTHRQCERLMRGSASERQRHKPCFALQCDIHRFFDSSALDPSRYRRPSLKDPGLSGSSVTSSGAFTRRTIFRRLAGSAGNLSRSLFANIYLDDSHSSSTTPRRIAPAHTMTSPSSLSIPANSNDSSEPILRSEEQALASLTPEGHRRKFGRGSTSSVRLLPRSRSRTRTRRGMYGATREDRYAHCGGLTEDGRASAVVPGILSHANSYDVGRSGEPLLAG